MTSSYGGLVLRFSWGLRVIRLLFLGNWGLLIRLLFLGIACVIWGIGASLFLGIACDSFAFPG